MCYVAIDTETTGLHPEEGHELIEVATIICDDSLTEVDRLSFRLGVERPEAATKRALEMTGYNKSTWNPKFKSHKEGLLYLNDFINYTTKKVGGDIILVGQNVKFDYKFLVAEYDRCALPNPVFGVQQVDLQEVAKMWAAHKNMSLQFRNLAYFCELAGIKNNRAHSAEADIEATLQALRIFLRQMGEKEYANCSNH